MAKIPIILESGRADGKLVTSDAIFDENKGMFQSELNDIQDTLNSDNPNKSLSAKQGKVLKELLDSKVIEAGSVPIDIEPTEGNTTNVVTSDGIYKALSKKVNTTIFEEKNKIQDEKLLELGNYVENLEYIKAYTDNEGRFLFGIKTDGSVEWVKGIPTPIKDVIDSIIKQTNQKLSVIDVISKVESPEYIYVITDEEDKILFSIDVDGKIYPETGVGATKKEEEFKYLSKPKTSIFPCSDILKNHIGATPEICYEEYYERCKDAGLICSRSWGISQDLADKYIANFVKYWGKDKTTESSIIYCQEPYLACDINTWYNNKNPLKDADAMSKWKHHIETLAERYNGVTEFTPTSGGVPFTDSPITYFQKYWDGFNEPMGSAYRGKDEDGNILMTEEEVIQMMKPYYECIKKHNPNSVVLTPSHDMVNFQYVNDNDFFNKMLAYKFIGEDGKEHRTWEYFDAIGIHYYHNNQEPETMMQIIGELQSLFYKYYLETGDKKLLSMPVYIGETNHPELARQLIIEQALGIEKSCIWTMLWEGTDNKLFNSDGTPTDRYYKVRALNKMMQEGSTRPTVEHDGNIYFAYWLDDCSIPTVAMWTTNKDNITIEIETSGICKLYNYLAEEIDFDNKQSKSITITSSIIYCKNANNFKYKILNKK